MDIRILELSFFFNGKEDAIYPVVLQSGGETILVDCGYEGFLPLIEQAAAAQGILLQQLTSVLITHHDVDHMGGLYELKEHYPQVKIHAFHLEEKYISGKKMSLRLQQAEDLYPCLPEAQKPGALHFQELLKSVRPVAVDAVFGEGNCRFCPEWTLFIPRAICRGMFPCT